MISQTDKDHYIEGLQTRIEELDAFQEKVNGLQSLVCVTDTQTHTITGVCYRHSTHTIPGVCHRHSTTQPLVCVTDTQTHTITGVCHRHLTHNSCFEIFDTSAYFKQNRWRISFEIYNKAIRSIALSILQFS